MPCVELRVLLFVRPPSMPSDGFLFSLLDDDLPMGQPQWLGPLTTPSFPPSSSAPVILVAGGLSSPSPKIFQRSRRLVVSLFQGNPLPVMELIHIYLHFSYLFSYPSPRASNPHRSSSVRGEFRPHPVGITIKHLQVLHDPSNHLVPLFAPLSVSMTCTCTTDGFPTKNRQAACRL